MQTQPLVSVLTTSFNREKYIVEAIEGVLVSTYTNFEPIVVENINISDMISCAKFNLLYSTSV